MAFKNDTIYKLIPEELLLEVPCVYILPPATLLRVCARFDQNPMSYRPKHAYVRTPTIDDVKYFLSKFGFEIPSDIKKGTELYEFFNDLIDSDKVSQDMMRSIFTKLANSNIGKMSFEAANNQRKKMSYNMKKENRKRKRDASEYDEDEDLLISDFPKTNFKDDDVDNNDVQDIPDVRLDSLEIPDSDLSEACASPRLSPLSDALYF